VQDIVPARAPPHERDAEPPVDRGREADPVRSSQLLRHKVGAHQRTVLPNLLNRSSEAKIRGSKESRGAMPEGDSRRNSWSHHNKL